MINHYATKMDTYITQTTSNKIKLMKLSDHIHTTQIQFRMKRQSSK